MLYLVCPPCGEILANKVLIYENEIKKICEDMHIDPDMISNGLGHREEEFKTRRSAVVNKLCRRMCCKQLMLTYVDIVYLIKG